MESAILMSAWGRMVRVGFCVGGAFGATGVMDARNKGHSIMVFESVLRRMGR